MDPPCGPQSGVERAVCLDDGKKSHHHHHIYDTRSSCLWVSVRCPSWKDRGSLQSLSFFVFLFYSLRFCQMMMRMCGATRRHIVLFPYQNSVCFKYSCRLIIRDYGMISQITQKDGNDDASVDVNIYIYLHILRVVFFNVFGNRLFFLVGCFTYNRFQNFRKQNDLSEFILNYSKLNTRFECSWHWESGVEVGWVMPI